MDDFCDSLVKLLKQWIIYAINEGIWIKAAQLPLAFRFAMWRPIMPEATFQSTLQSMGLQDNLDLGNMPTSHTQPFPHLRGTTKKLICGIDVDRSIKHVSTALKHSLSRAGSPTGMEEEVSEKEASKETEVDDATLEIETRQCLWSLYDRIQKGHIDLKEAPSRYRSALELYDADNEVLIMGLHQFGIPDTKQWSTRFPWSTKARSVQHL